MLILAAWQFGEAAYIAVKARLAQHLIATAWARATHGAAPPKPWPWADTGPIAKLSVREHSVTLYVLSDASGRSLAFGPGHVTGTTAPGRAGNTVISGHRDTHFAFLEHVREGEEIVLELPNGAVHRYRVSDSAIVHQREVGVLRPGDEDVLTLLTCFPFRAVNPRGPLRYVVTATRA